MRGSLSVVLALIALFSTVHSARALDDVAVDNAPPDSKAVSAINAALGARIHQDIQHSQDLGFQTSTNIADLTTAAWVRVDDDEPSYLFVIINSECGASDCDIIGLRPTKSGWVKVYDVFGGDGITLLDTKTNGHRDIEQDMSGGEGHYIALTSHWAKNSYGKPTKAQH
jgi:hypothetical protein